MKPTSDRTQSDALNFLAHSCIFSTIGSTLAFSWLFIKIRHFWINHKAKYTTSRELLGKICWIQILFLISHIAQAMLAKHANPNYLPTPNFLEIKLIWGLPANPEPH
jgi:uncharacterized membrane protein